MDKGFNGLDTKLKFGIPTHSNPAIFPLDKHVLSKTSLDLKARKCLFEVTTPPA